MPGIARFTTVWFIWRRQIHQIYPSSLQQFRDCNWDIYSPDIGRCEAQDVFHCCECNVESWLSFMMIHWSSLADTSPISYFRPRQLRHSHHRWKQAKAGVMLSLSSPKWTHTFITVILRFLWNESANKSHQLAQYPYCVIAVGHTHGTALLHG